MPHPQTSQTGLGSHSAYFETVLHSLWLEFLPIVIEYYSEMIAAQYLCVFAEHFISCRGDPGHVPWVPLLLSVIHATACHPFLGIPSCVLNPSVCSPHYSMTCLYLSKTHIWSRFPDTELHLSWRSGWSASSLSLSFVTLFPLHQLLSVLPSPSPARTWLWFFFCNGHSCLLQVPPGHLGHWNPFKAVFPRNYMLSAWQICPLEMFC